MKYPKLWLYLGLFAAACLPTAAQSLHFDVPFDFVAGGKQMLAGEYRVGMTFSGDNTAWAIIGAGNSVIVLTNAVQPTKTGHKVSLVFLRSGGRLSLAEIWPSEYAGRETLRTKVKKTLIAQGATYVEIRAE